MSNPTAKKKEEGGGGGPAKAKVPVGADLVGVDLTKVCPVNILKAAKDPLYRDDKEYPEWLFMLLEEPPTLNELLAMDPSQLTLKQIKKIQKITSKAKIKANNAALRKT